MALLVLLSTFSFTIEKHFCGEFLVDISYFGEAGGCEEELGEVNCDNPCIIKEKKCCTDEVAEIEGQDDLKISSIENISFEHHFALAFTIAYHNLFVDFTNKSISYEEYAPPNLITDIQVLHEVFII